MDFVRHAVLTTRRKSPTGKPSEELLEKRLTNDEMCDKTDEISNDEKTAMKGANVGGT